MFGRIAIYLDHPKCSVDGVNAIMNALQPHYTFNIVTKHNIQDPTFWNSIDVFAVPGGIGDVEGYHKSLANHRDNIHKFLDFGGRYLGICMGAYWAGPNYLNILKNLDAVQYLCRPNRDTYRPHAKDLGITWNGIPENMFWYDGCSIVGRGKFDVVATYPNGDAMAGYQGRIGLIGSHPEAEEYWYTMYSWMKPKWELGRSRNNTLLKEFVDTLMTR